MPPLGQRVEGCDHPAAAVAAAPAFMDTSSYMEEMYERTHHN